MQLSLIISLGLSFVALSLQQNDAPSLKDLLAEQANLTSFSEFLTNSLPDLLSELEAKQEAGEPITILAPSNAAFDKIIYYPVIGPAWGGGNLDLQREIMKYHILPGDITTDALLPTFQYFPTMLINSTVANVTEGQKVGAVMQGGKLLFWVSGESNRSPSTINDLKFAGGTVHIVDSLLIPPQSLAITASKFSAASEPTMLTSFLGAAYSIKNGSLISTINSAKDITIFAPNNAAMELVGEALTSMSPEALEKLLSYHIVIGSNGNSNSNSSGSSSSAGGPYYSTSLMNATTLQTLAGNPLSVTFESNSVFVNSARVLTTDLLISGGVLHVLDNVLNPDATGVSADPSLETQAPVLETVGSDEGDTPFTSAVPDISSLIVEATARPDPATSAMASRSRTASAGRPSQTAVKKGGAPALDAGRQALLGLAAAGIVGLAVNI